MSTPMYCPNCGTLGSPTTRIKGSFLTEVVLWLCFLLPGLIYSVWRLSSKEKVCPSCGAPNMIPANSPRRANLDGRPVTADGTTKKCPFCAETIKAEAIVCRYCGKDLPAAAPVRDKPNVAARPHTPAPPPMTNLNDASKFYGVTSSDDPKVKE